MSDLFTPDQLDAAREAWQLACAGPAECICGESSRDVVATEDRFGLPLYTLRCCACGTLRSSDVVRPDQLEHFYRDLYPVMHPGLSAHREAREMRQARWLTFECMVAPMRVIEIGGRCARYCMMTADYCSIDIAGESKAPVFSADFLVALHVLEHCADPVATLREWADYLDPDGAMIVAVPDTLEVHHHRHVKALGFRGWLQLAHTWGWTEANVSLPFIKAGLRVTRVHKAPPGTLATVGSLVVEARRDWALDDYLEGHDA